MFYQCICILVLSSSKILSIAYKTDTWPPLAKIEEQYHVTSIVAKCKETCNTNLNEVKEFELTTNLDNLPNSKELKCYFHCGYMDAGFMKPNSPKIDFSSFVDLMSTMTNEEIDNYLKMSKGCAAQARKIKEPTEVAYHINVCAKRNSPELYYTHY